MTIWAIWVAGCVATFLIIEAYVLLTGQPTLSQTIRDLGAHYPLFEVSFGGAVIGLIVHFFDR